MARCRPRITRMLAARLAGCNRRPCSNGMLQAQPFTTEASRANESGLMRCCNSAAMSAPFGEGAPHEGTVDKNCTCTHENIR